MGYILLIFLLLILLIDVYKSFDKDILSPSLVVIATYFLSVLFAFIANRFDLWNYVNDLSTYVLTSIIIAVISFCISEYLVRKIILKKINTELKEKKHIVYSLNNITYFVILTFILITGFLIYSNLANLTGEYFNISKMISTYRNGSLFANGNEIYKLNFFVMQMFRCIDIIGFVLIYIIVNSYLLTKKIRPNIKYGVLILLICIISLLISGRTLILKYIIAFVLCYNILKFRYKGTTLEFKKLIKPLLIFAIVGIPLFYFSLSFLGRNKNHGIINYTTFYFGSPIASLEEVSLSSNEFAIVVNRKFGTNTFVGLQTILNKINVKLFNQPNQFKWINYSHGLSNNVFTGIYPYIADFGLIGVFICQFIFGSFISLCYYLAKYKKNPIFIIFLCMMGIYIFDSYRSEKMFTSIISLNTIIYVIYMIAILFALSKIVQTKEVV